MAEDWIVLCQALYQSTREEEWTALRKQFKEVSEKSGVKRAGQKVAGSGKLACKLFDRRSAGARELSDNLES